MLSADVARCTLPLPRCRYASALICALRGGYARVLYMALRCDASDGLRERL